MSLPTHTLYAPKVDTGAVQDSYCDTEADDAVVQHALEILEARFAARYVDDSVMVCNHTTVEAYLRLKIAEYSREVFGLVLLDNRHRVLGVEIVHMGTIDSAEVRPRIVVELALKRGAAAVIAFHNHPSGNPEPSAADRIITRRLHECLQMIEVRLLDHIVIGAGECYAFSKHGLMP